MPIGIRTARSRYVSHRSNEILTIVSHERHTPYADRRRRIESVVR
jgi:hypothetical protein